MNTVIAYKCTYSSPPHTAILLGTLRMEYKAVRSMVLSCDKERLTEQLLEQLSKFMPSRDEMIQLMSYRDKTSDLAEAEQFGVVVSVCVCVCASIRIVILASLLCYA